MSSNADFQFIMTDTLGQKADSPLFKALDKSGITDVGGITSLTDRVIDRLKYPDNSSGTIVTEELGHGYQQLIRCFNAFVLTKNDEGNRFMTTGRTSLSNLSSKNFGSLVLLRTLYTRHQRRHHQTVLLVAPHLSLPGPETVFSNSKRGSNVIQLLLL